MGIPLCADHHAASQDGLSRIELTVAGGKRASTARTYLAPAMGRRNLTVHTGAHVTRIVLEGRRATGVEYVRAGSPQSVRATREVILCGGAYHSPHLLQVSGIGLRHTCESVGVKVLHDLPGVGANLVEHPNLLNIYRLQSRQGFTKYLRFDRAALAVLRWYWHGEGPFSTAGSTGNLFLRTQPGLSRPDIQIVSVSVHQHAKLWFPLLTQPPEYAITARIGVLHPQSRGWVRLRSANPLDLPRFCFNMLTEPADVEAMVRALEPLASCTPRHRCASRLPLSCCPDRACARRKRSSLICAGK